MLEFFTKQTDLAAQFLKRYYLSVQGKKAKVSPCLLSWYMDCDQKNESLDKSNGNKFGLSLRAKLRSSLFRREARIRASAPLQLKCLGFLMRISPGLRPLEVFRAILDRRSKTCWTNYKYFLAWGNALGSPLMSWRVSLRKEAHGFPSWFPRQQDLVEVEGNGWMLWPVWKRDIFCINLHSHKLTTFIWDLRKNNAGSFLKVIHVIHSFN